METNYTHTHTHTHTHAHSDCSHFSYYMQAAIVVCDFHAVGLAHLFGASLDSNARSQVQLVTLFRCYTEVDLIYRRVWVSLHLHPHIRDAWRECGVSQLAAVVTGEAFYQWAFRGFGMDCVRTRGSCVLRSLRRSL